MFPQPDAAAALRKHGADLWHRCHLRKPPPYAPWLTSWAINRGKEQQKRRHTATPPKLFNQSVQNCPKQIALEIHLLSLSAGYIVAHLFVAACPNTLAQIGISNAAPDKLILVWLMIYRIFFNHVKTQQWTSWASIRTSIRKWLQLLSTSPMPVAEHSIELMLFSNVYSYSKRS